MWALVGTPLAKQAAARSPTTNKAAARYPNRAVLAAARPHQPDGLRAVRPGPNPLPTGTKEQLTVAALVRANVQRAKLGSSERRYRHRAVFGRISRAELQ